MHGILTEPMLVAPFFHYLYIIPFLSSFLSARRLFLAPYLSFWYFPCNWKKNLSTAVLNSYNFMTLTCNLHVFCFSPGQTFVFHTEIYIYLLYSYVQVTLLFLLLFAPRISLLLYMFLLFFSTRGTQERDVVMANDPFSDLPVFSSEESLWSEIINPFLDSPNKNAPLTHIGRIID